MCCEVPDGDDVCGWLPESEVVAALIECCPFCECSRHVGRVEGGGRVIYHEAVDLLFSQSSVDAYTLGPYLSRGRAEVVGNGRVQFGWGPFAGKLVQLP
jgi:hypothetical protein